MRNRIIVIPKFTEPAIDRVNLPSGSATFLISFEGKPLWVSGIIPGRLLQLFDGWIAYEYPPKKFEGRRKGSFFRFREDALLKAEDMIKAFIKEAFPCYRRSE